MAVFELGITFSEINMGSKRNAIQTLVRSGIRGVQLVRSDPKGPVGKYIASIKINGQYLCGYDCCVICRKLLKSGRNSARIMWAHKICHLAEGGVPYTDQDLEDVVTTFNCKPSKTK